MDTTRRRFRDISAIAAELVIAGLHAQTGNDLLTMDVCAASQHALRVSFFCLRTKPRASTRRLSVSGHNSSTSSPLFHLPLKLAGLGVASAEQRHAAAPRRAWQSVLPTLVTATESPDATPFLSPRHNSVPNFPSYKPHSHDTGTPPRFSSSHLALPSTPRPLHPTAIPQTTIRQPRHCTHQQSRTLISQTSLHTSAHLQRPNSEAHEAEDSCFRVSTARRLMMPHPAIPDPWGKATACPNKSATGLVCANPVDAHQHHCSGCRYGGGVDRRHAAVARCLAVVVKNPQRRPSNNQVEPRAWTSCLIITLATTLIDALLSSNPGLISAASALPSYMAKRAEKIKFDRHPHINLVPLVLDTTAVPAVTPRSSSAPS